MSSSSLRRRAALDEDLATGVSAAPLRTRTTTQHIGGREALADVLRAAEEFAQVHASVQLEFEEAAPAEAFQRRLERIKRENRQLDKYLLVEQSGRAFRIVYNPQAAEMPALPGRAHAQRSMRAMASRRELLRAADFANALGVTKQAVSKALRDKRVFTVEVDGEQYYPAFYLDSRLDRRQLERVTKALGDLPGPSKLQFFLRPKHSLGGVTPLRALAQGRFEQVRASALGFAER